MTNPAILNEYDMFARGLTQRMLVFARERFQVPDLQFNVRFNHKPLGNSRAVRVGERYFISYAFARIVDKQLQGFKEYSSFAGHPVIGSIKTDDWKVFVTAVVAHEVSHIVQFWLGKHTNNPLRHPERRNVKGEAYFDGLGFYEGGHGSFFQAIYRIFRKEFVNHLVSPEQLGVRINHEIEGGYQKLTNVPQVLDDNSPLKGLLIKINNHSMTVLGQNANQRRRLYGYRAQSNSTGTIYSIQLGDIITCAVDKAKIQEIMDANPALRSELAAFQDAKASVRKATATRRRRAAHKASFAF